MNTAEEIIKWQKDGCPKCGRKVVAKCFIVNGESQEVKDRSFIELACAGGVIFGNHDKMLVGRCEGDEAIKAFRAF